MQIGGPVSAQSTERRLSPQPRQIQLEDAPGLEPIRRLPNQPPGPPGPGLRDGPPEPLGRRRVSDPRHARTNRPPIARILGSSCRVRPPEPWHPLADERAQLGAQPVAVPGRLSESGGQARQASSLAAEANLPTSPRVFVERSLCPSRRCHLAEARWIIVTQGDTLLRLEPCPDASHLHSIQIRHGRVKHGGVPTLVLPFAKIGAPLGLEPHRKIDS
jgi:hypothetical protein